jgi:magnesium-transporting ATPase (P-type)
MYKACPMPIPPCHSAAGGGRQRPGRPTSTSRDALSRLWRSGIFCISPNRINVAGKVNVCCFDKTGTLSEDGRDILGVRALDHRSGMRFGELLDNVYDLPGPVGREKAIFLYVLATCHQHKIVDGEVIDRGTRCQNVPVYQVAY